MSDRIRDVLFAAGPQWGDRSPDDIIRALDAAGYMIVRKNALVSEGIGLHTPITHELLEARLQGRSTDQEC